MLDFKIIFNVLVVLAVVEVLKFYIPRIYNFYFRDDEDDEYEKR